MHMADIGEHEVEPYELLTALEELGVDVDHWSLNAPREDAADDSSEMLPRLREVVFTNREKLECLAGLLGEEELRKHLAKLAVKRSKPEKVDIRALADEFRHAGSLWIDALLSVGDEKLALAGEAGLLLYRQAIEDAPRPSVHAEIGFLLLARAGIDDLPYCEFDFHGEWWPKYTSAGDIKWTEWLRPRSELITEQRLSGSKISPSGRLNALSLGLDSYGRAYSYYLRHASDLEDLCQPSDGAELDWTELWRQFLVLDGLRVTLLELDRLHEASLACVVYEIWSQAFNDISRATFEDSQFQRRFAETSGFIRGRQVELTVQEAVEEARRKIVVSDPDAFATQVAETVAAQLGPMPLATRSQIEERLETALSDAWRHLADSVRQFDRRRVAARPLGDG